MEEHVSIEIMLATRWLNTGLNGRLRNLWATLEKLWEKRFFGHERSPAIAIALKDRAASPYLGAIYYKEFYKCQSSGSIP